MENSKSKNREVLVLLMDQYFNDSFFLSGPYSNHPYYRYFVAAGKEYPKDIIPFLLELIEFDFDICSMLYEIVGTKESPAVPIEEAGHIQYIVDLWITWGKAQGYIKPESKQM